jgi:F-type H+-transporting ATPase subunit b
VKRFSLVLLAVPLAAAEQAGAEARHGPSPWLWANFVILMGVLIYLARKHGGPFLAERDAAIQKGISDAAAKKADADRRVADVDQRLANLDTEIANLKVQMREEQQQEAKRLADRNAQEIARLGHQSEQEMETAAKAARLELQAHAAKLALSLAEQKLRTEMNPETQHRLTGGFVESLR